MRKCATKVGLLPVSCSRLKYGFCKKLLLSECNSDRLNISWPFFLHHFRVGLVLLWCWFAVAPTQKWWKNGQEMFKLSELHSERNNFLQNPYFRRQLLLQFSFSEKTTKICTIFLIVWTFTEIFGAFSEKLNLKEPILPKIPRPKTDNHGEMVKKNIKKFNKTKNKHEILSTEPTKIGHILRK